MSFTNPNPPRKRIASDDRIWELVRTFDRDRCLRILEDVFETGCDVTLADSDIRGALAQDLIETQPGCQRSAREILAL